MGVGGCRILCCDVLGFPRRLLAGARGVAEVLAVCLSRARKKFTTCPRKKQARNKPCACEYC